MFKLLKILTFLLIGAMSGTVFAQWSSQYEGHMIGDQPSTESKAYSIAADSGYSYVVGYTADLSGSSMCLVKYDVNGDTVWTDSFTGGGQTIENKAYAVVVDKLRNIIITGYATTPNGIDIATIKYSPDGVQQWVRYYNDSLNLDDKAYAITLDGFNNIYITGYTTVGINETRYVIIKYDQYGDTAWTCFGDGLHDTATSITMVGDNYVAITGRSLNNSSIPDIVTVLYDANTGDRKWSSALGLSSNTDAKGNAITSDANGNIYVTGYVTQANTGKDIVIVKYNVDNQYLWEKTIENALDDIGNSIGLSAYGDVLVTGTTSASDSSTNHITARYSSTGDFEWQQSYNGPGNATDVAYKMAVSTADNSVYVTGSSMSGTDAGSTDMYTIKYDIATGDAIDSSRLSTSSANADISYDIAIDQTQSVFITGVTLPTGGNNLNAGAKMLTAKFSNFKKNNHKNTVISVPKNFKLYQNYPNPFNPGTIIKFEVGKSSNVKLVIYDIIGKEVQTLVNSNYNPGTYTVNFNKPGLASGVYFYVLTAGEFRDIKKMILLK